VLTDLQQRGVEGALTACVEGLKGFPKDIAGVFFKILIQPGIVRQIRTSLRYVSKKTIGCSRSLKPLCKAVNADQGQGNIFKFEAKSAIHYSQMTRHER
jgi:transposase-like protein